MCIMEETVTKTTATKSKPGAKTRNHNGYSRNGCSRCKGQRVRCDEQSPECGRCMRAGVKCPGLGQRLRWSTKYEVFRNNNTPKKPRQAKTATPVEIQQPLPVAPLVHELSLPQEQAEHLVHLEQPAEFQSTEEPCSTEGWESLIDHLFPEPPEYTDLLFGNSPPLIDLPSELSLLHTPPEQKALEEEAEEEVVLPTKTSQPPVQSSRIYWLDEQTQRSHFRPHSPSRNLVRSSKDQQLSFKNAAYDQLNKGMMKPSKPLNDPGSVLVEFYFKETAQVYSCYDSKMNPFRTTVSRLWSSSPIIYRTLQSMAAASLVDDFPQFGPLGRQLRVEAIEMLEKNPGSDMDCLLAMLMLGGTASWHNPQDLGLPFFNQIRRKLASIPSSALGEGNDNNYRFFCESMTYWEMLLAYVAENDALDPLEAPQVLDHPLSLQVVPHPWTGFARDAQYAVQQIGRLIRRQRKIAYAHRFASIAHIRQLEKDMATASELEQRLVNLSHPIESSVVDPEDGNTPVWHLLTLAEVYRATGLIQLYHAFPDLLDQRLRRDGLLFPAIDGDGTTADTDVSPQMRHHWLTSYGLQTLDMMKSIPLESGTRDFQPFILVSLSSELRMLKRDSSLSIADTGHDVSNDLQVASFQTIEVSRMRRFIESRLNSFLHILPPKPIRVCLDIVKRTWEMMDDMAQVEVINPGGISEGPKDIYWMDVVIENGWETTMA